MEFSPGTTVRRGARLAIAAPRGQCSVPKCLISSVPGQINTNGYTDLPKTCRSAEYWHRTRYTHLPSTKCLVPIA